VADRELSQRFINVALIRRRLFLPAESRFMRRGWKANAMDEFGRRGKKTDHSGHTVVTSFAICVR